MLLFGRKNAFFSVSHKKCGQINANFGKNFLSSLSLFLDIFRKKVYNNKVRFKMPYYGGRKGVLPFRKKKGFENNG